MAVTIPDIPRPRSGDPETQRFYDAVRQAFAAVQRTDNQALVTYEELGRRLLPLYDQYKNISDKVGGGKACDGASVPGAVSNIQTSGAFGVITLTWDAAVYRGHGSTEVWASKDTDREAAELVGTSETTYLEHAVPAFEFTTENGYEVSRNYWLRHVSACDKGYGPWSDMVTASTPASPSLIGEMMSAHANDMLNALGLDQDLSGVIADARIAESAMRDSSDAAARALAAVESGVYETSSITRDADGMHVSYLDVVKAETDSAIAGVITTIEATTNEAGAAVDYSQIIGAVFENDFAGVRTDVEASVNAQGAEVDYLQFIGAEFGDNLAGVTDRINATVTDVSAFVEAVQTTQAVFEDNLATVQTTTKAYADDTSAYASMETALSAAVGDTASAMTIQAEVDTISAKYAIQTDVKGYVQGFGLLNTGSPTTSGMTFNVNNFYVTNTVNGTKYHPFMIEGNKVYADNLFVKQANIEKLNVMDIATSGIIKSANYVSGSSGWKIDNDGVAEFESLTVRTKNIEDNAVTAVYSADGPMSANSRAEVAFTTTATSDIIIIASAVQGASGQTMHIGFNGTVVRIESPINYSLASMQYTAKSQPPGDYWADVQGNHPTSPSSITVIVRYK